MNFRQNAILFRIVLSKNLYPEDIMQHVRLPELSVHNHGISSPVICEPMQFELSANTHMPTHTDRLHNQTQVRREKQHAHTHARTRAQPL